MPSDPLDLSKKILKIYIIPAIKFFLTKNPDMVPEVEPKNCTLLQTEQHATWLFFCICVIHESFIIMQSSSQLPNPTCSFTNQLADIVESAWAEEE
jgi:hypothetical protein